MGKKKSKTQTRQLGALKPFRAMLRLMISYANKQLTHSVTGRKAGTRQAEEHYLASHAAMATLHHAT